MLALANSGYAVGEERRFAHSFPRQGTCERVAPFGFVGQLECVGTNYCGKAKYSGKQ
jgi:hypothetical protein